MSARRLALGALLCLLLGGLVLAATRVGQRGRFSAAYSTHGAGPEGTRALYRLVQELGFRPARLSHELSHLERGTLLAVAGCDGELARPLLRPEREELLRWVEAGGLLIVAGVEDYAPESSGLAFERPATCEDSALQSWLEDVFEAKKPAGEPLPKELLAIPAGPPLAHATPFLAAHPRTVRADADSHATLLLDSEHGPLGMSAALGRGRVVLLGVSDALTNRALQTGGAVVIGRLLQSFAPKEGPVWFDEYHLGMGERRSLIGYLRDRGYGGLMLQVVLVVLALMLARAVRLGRPEPAGAALPRTRGTYLTALSNLYEQTGDAAGALQVIGRDGLRRIGRRYRATGIAPEQLSSWLDKSGLGAAAECARRVEELAAQPLERGEQLVNRARAIESAVVFALALGELG